AAGLPFPTEPAVFKVEGNFPELRASDAQNSVKIVPVIFPVIDDKRNLRTDVHIAEINLRNPHASALKCSADVHYPFFSERLKIRGVGQTALKEHQVRTAGVYHQVHLMKLRVHLNGHYRRIGLKWSRETKASGRAEEHLLRSIVNAKTA